MKTLSYLCISALLLFHCGACSSQERFREYLNNFLPLNLPLEDIVNLTGHDTLNGRLTNDIIIRSQEEKPQYVDKEGNVKTIKQYYGLYPEEPFDYLKDIINVHLNIIDFQLYTI